MISQTVRTPRPFNELPDEHEELFPGQLTESPFAGATIAKLRLVNQALYGHIVEVELARPDGREPVRGVFLGCAVPPVPPGPGGWVYGYGFAPMLGDLRIGKSWSGEHSVGSGTCHVLGLGALRRFEVVSRDAWYCCERCQSWRPRALLTWSYWGREVDGVYDDSMGYDRDGPLVCENTNTGDAWGDYCA